MAEQKENIGFHSLRVCFMGRGPGTRPAVQLEGGMMAEFEFSSDVGFLFPYINAVAERAQLYESPSHIRFSFKKTLCVIYPDRGLASPFDDSEHARAFMIELTAFFNDICSRKNQIEPRYKYFRHTAVTEILKLLPQTNCKECGFNTCTAFAAMLSQQQTIPGRCPHIGRPVQEKAIYPVHDADGKLLSTIALDIDNTEAESDLDSARQYIDVLKEKIRRLSAVKKELRDSANEELPAPLSRREIEVLERLACGSTNTEIAQSLHISPHTVKSHITHIFNKLGVNSRASASVWATQNHFI